MRRLLALSAALLVALGARCAQAQPTELVQGPFGPGGTWNIYEFVDVPLVWWEANEDAMSRTEQGFDGHLADVLSAGENAWLFSVGGYAGDWWLGLTDRAGNAPPVTNGGLPAPQESRVLPSPTTQGWAWTSGKLFTYQNWGGGEPNDSTGEDAVHMRSDGMWNDHKSGLGLNDPTVSSESTDETAAPTIRYIVEYPTQRATQWPGIAAPAVSQLLPLELPGNVGPVGSVIVTDLYGLGVTVSTLPGVANILDQIADGIIVPDVAVETYALSDVADPDTSPTGGPVLGGTPLPYPSDVPGTDDNSFISIAKGTLKIDAPGTYTIQARSDDGLGMRVRRPNGTTLPFTSVHGAAAMDQDGSMIFAADTGDANSRGVVNFPAAGNYTFEFLMWENGGGAWWELTKAEGAQPNVNGTTARWTPLVDAAGLNPSLLPKDLPGVDGGEGTVGVTDFYDLALNGTAEQVSPFSDAAALIERIKSGDPALTYEVASGQFAITAARDPDTNGGTTILGGAAPAFPSDNETASAPDDNDFISIARGTVMVPQTGTYTIQVHSDDGMGLRMIGAPFKEVYGNGQLDVDGSIIHPADTGDSNTRGVIQLTKGQHQFEFMFWERGGGAFWEITSSSGSHPDQGTARWLALGDGTVLNEVNRTGPGVARLVGNATVVQNMASADSGAGAPYIEVAIDEVQDALGIPTSPKRTDVSTVLIWDQTNYARPSAAVAGEKFRFPSNEGNNTDFNNFSTGVFGKLQVDDGDAVAGETITVTFGMFTDDHSLFRVVGQDFTAVGGDVNTQLLNIEGDDTLAFDLPTGNSNALGLIQLREGQTYDFEGYHHENAGGANYEIWAALGDQLTINLGDAEAFLSVFYPLSNKTPTIFLPGNMGLELVKYVPGVLGDFNSSGVLDAGDLDLQAAAMVAGGPNDPYDLNGDNAVNINDRLFWLHDLKETWVGDSDLNGLFNSADFVLAFQAGKYEVAGAAATWVQGDWNGDQFFTSADFVAAFADGGYEAGPRTAVSAVPEPSSLVLVLLGLAGLLGAARRRS